MYRIAGQILLAGALFFAAQPAHADGTSVWNHNGSTIDLFANGTNRVFRYRDPRAGMRDEGVVPGTVLFEGYRSGDAFTGTAYAFSRRCGAIPFAVTGQVSTDQRQVTLYGKSPARLDDSCRTTAYRADVLGFEFLYANAPAVAGYELRQPSANVAQHRHVPAPALSAPVMTPSTPTFAPPLLSPLGWVPTDTAILGAIVTILSLVALAVLILNRSPVVAFASHASSPTPEHEPMHLDTTSPPPLPQHVAPPPLATSSGKIYLKLRRSQKAGLMGGKPTFVLDARADVTAEARALISKYGLGSLVIYDSKARLQRAEAAFGHFDLATVLTPGKALWKTARGLASAAMMGLSLRVTVNNLITGQHIACKDLDELLGAEAAIVEACKNLKGYLETALTFDGREELLEF